MAKRRLSVSIDSDLVEAAERSLASGRTLSAYDSDALRLKLEHDRRLAAMRAFIAEYEREHGEITEDEMRAASRRLRARAVSMRALPGRASQRGKRP